MKRTILAMLVSTLLSTAASAELSTALLPGPAFGNPDTGIRQYECAVTNTSPYRRTGEVSFVDMGGNAPVSGLTYDLEGQKTARYALDIGRGAGGVRCRVIGPNGGTKEAGLRVSLCLRRIDFGPVLSEDIGPCLQAQ